VLLLVRVGARGDMLVWSILKKFSPEDGAMSAETCGREKVILNARVLVHMCILLVY